jgi:hypothetical protein
VPRPELNLPVELGFPFLAVRVSTLTRNFRLGLQIRASYASPALDTTNLPPEQAPSEIA